MGWRSFELQQDVTPAFLRSSRAATACEPAGVVIEVVPGPLAWFRARYPAGYLHGACSLETARCWDAADLAIAACDPGARRLAPASWGYLDLETTGLGTGAGVLAFLIGLAGWEGDDFVVEQFLLRDIGEEPALLDAVATRLGRFAGILSFNGKAFDLPLLRTRLALARRTLLPVAVHCDLLHVARRLWKHRLADRRLGHLEIELLGFERHGDIAGARIPDLYLDCLRRGRWDRLEPILVHNRNDLLSLCALAHQAASFVAGARAGDVASDQMRIAHVLERAGEADTALDLYERSARPGGTAEVRRASLHRLASLYKRRGAFEKSRQAWLRLVDLDASLADPYEELAKQAEHRDRDPGRALEWVDLALSSAVLDAEDRQAFEHRRRRLVRKLHGAPHRVPRDSGDGTGPPRDFFLASWS